MDSQKGELNGRELLIDIAGRNDWIRVIKRKEFIRGVGQTGKEGRGLKPKRSLEKLDAFRSAGLRIALHRPVSQSADKTARRPAAG